MAQLDPTDLAKILKTVLPAAQATQQTIQNITSEINKTLTLTANANQRLIKSLSYSDELVEEMAENFDKIKNSVNGTKLGELVLDRKTMDDFADKFGDVQNEIRTTYRFVKKYYDELDKAQKSYDANQTDATTKALARAKLIYQESSKNLNILIKQAELIQDQADAYVDLKQKAKQFNDELESKAGFDSFKSALGIYGKIPIVARSLENMSRNQKMIFGYSYKYISMFYSAFDEVQNAFIKTVKTLGLLKNEAQVINKFITDTTVDFVKYGVTAEEVAATVGSMVETFGSLSLFNENVARDITLISKQLGVGNKELTEGVMALSSFGKIDMVKATKVVYFASALSKAAGVPLAKVMEDVAKAGDKARGLIRGGAEELIKASVYARRLGTDLEKVADVGRKMLDFQESITDEIEASVVLGSNISFQKARELFYTGKIQEGYDEIFKVVKSIGDFNKLDIFQKELIAKATGLSLTDLQKQSQIREDLAEIERNGTEQAKKMVQEYKRLNVAGEGLVKNTIEEREARVRNIINLKETEEITARIKDLFMGIGKIALPIIEGFLKGINFILSAFDGTVGKIIFGLGAIVLTISSIIKSAQIFKALSMNLKGLYSSIKGVSTTVTAQMTAQAAATQAATAAEVELAAARRAAGLTGLAGLTGGLAATEILALGGAVLFVAGAFVLLALGLKQFKDINLEDVGLGLLSLAGLIAITAAAIDASSEITIPAAGVIALLGLAVAVLAASLLMAGNGVKAFGEGLKFAVDALKDFGQNVGFLDSIKLASVFAAINSSISGFDLTRLQSIVTAMQSLAAALNNISAFKGFPQLTLPTNVINTTNTPGVLTNTPTLTPTPTTNVPASTNTVTENSAGIIDAVRQGIKEGMNNISLNVYLDSQRMLTGLSKNAGFGLDTGGVAMQSSPR